VVTTPQAAASPLGVVGLGRLGLAIALTLERAGHAVVGVERDAARAGAIARRTLESVEPGVDRALREARRLELRSDAAELPEAGCEVVLVAVATPSTDDGGYDHSALVSVADRLAAAGPQQRPRDLAIVSTVMPGTTDALARRLAPLGWRVSYNPSFIALGSVIANLESPDVCLLGVADPAAAERIVGCWRPAWKREPALRILAPREAELAKIATNSFLTLKIAFANAVGDLALRLGGRPEAVLGALAADPRIGERCLGHGFGYGGPCLPRDNRALDRAALQFGTEGFPLGRAADAANASHLDFQVRSALEKPPGEVVTLDHATYKPGPSSLEESQPLAFALALARAGRRVRIRERPVVIETLRAEWGDLFEYEVEPRD
jgi:nucleotide sugar dehydrogenase